MSTPILTFTPVTDELRRFEGWTERDLNALDATINDPTKDPLIQRQATRTKIEYKTALLTEANAVMDMAKRWDENQLTTEKG